ncbi:HlyD family type I secretion periplasmic adaptor subunit [Bacteroidia bacterium]|nr:HlyD family type I secretion periplasmic adaptor subunit [Bacteroidia bacterium]GHT28609.1 HlyD family type I secretion periplasmic adaptor subunit [Bacteroidia bacterium]
MPQIFPPEIIEYSAENYYSQLRTKSKIIYSAILLSIAFSMASLPFIKVDISAQSRGVIRTPMENTVLQSSVYGEVTAYRLHENKTVVEGDTLIIFNTERLDEQIRLNLEKKEQNDRFIEDIDRLLKGVSKPQSSKYIAEYNRYLSKINDQRIQIDFLKKDYETTQLLYQKAIVSEFDYLTLKNNLDKAESLLVNMKEEFHATWQSEQTNLEIENQTLLSNIRQLEKEKRNYIIMAPVSGALVQVSGFQAGNFIGPNQAIAYISASDSLLAECYISPSDIGLIHEGQDVVFQFDAFDYREWGLIEGKVTGVLKDIVTVSDRPMFRVRCKLNTNCLQLKNSYLGCIQKGMTLTGRFQLTRRSLWQLMFDKVDDWMNPKIIKQ